MDTAVIHYEAPKVTDLGEFQEATGFCFSLYASELWLLFMGYLDCA